MASAGCWIAVWSCTARVEAGVLVTGCHSYLPRNIQLGPGCCWNYEPPELTELDTLLSRGRDFKLKKYSLDLDGMSCLCSLFSGNKEQCVGEPFENFYAELRALATPYEFGDQEDKLLRAQIILGVNSILVMFNPPVKFPPVVGISQTELI
uniref:Uncharacterized protein n=1 Tax=Timema cristinae TaxID=61476 RepID=A0A7R9D5X2_TIMCR|nr:unnamed protein product [Timema cristinae]